MGSSYERYQELRDKLEAGSLLSEPERADFDSLCASDPAAKQEEQLLAQLAALDFQVSPESEEAIISGALEAHQEAEKVVPLRREGHARRMPLSSNDTRQKRNVIRKRRVAAVAAVAAMTIGSGVQLWHFYAPDQRVLSFDETSSRSVEAVNRTAAVFPFEPELALTAGEVWVDGKKEGAGARVLPPGSRVETGEGRACLSLDATSDICLGEKSQLTLTESHWELDRGTAFVAHETAAGRESRSLQVKVGPVVLSAVRSSYFLERKGSRTELRVHEGELALQLESESSEGRSLGAAYTARAREGLLLKEERIEKGEEVTRLQAAADRLLIAPRQLWRSSDRGEGALGRIEIESQPPGALVRVDDVTVGRTPLALLSSVGARHVQVGEGDAVQARSIQLSAGEDLRLAFSLPVVEARAPKLNAAPDLSGLLAQARQAMGSGDFVGAARAYRQIRSSYPSRAESRTILVTLGQLELDRLGQPAQALASFEAYLRGGGSLAREAKLGRIRALARLGRSSAETQAIEQYLAGHGASAEASRLRERLKLLRSK